MTTFAGHYLGLSGSIPVPGLSASWTTTHPRPPSAPDLRDLVPLINGVYSNEQPISLVTRTIDGHYQFSFADDYYNRVWVIPRLLSFGVVAQRTEQTFYIWNAQFEPTSYTGYSVEGDAAGLTLGSITSGTIKPLQLITSTLTAAADGPAEFGLSYSFGFSLGNSATLAVSGLRGKIWPFRPNWSTPFSTIYDYKTDIITTRSGREQRRAVRRTARKALEFKATIRDSAELRKLQENMAYWHARSYIVPEFPLRAIASTSMALGGTSIQVEAVPDWLVADITVALSDGANASLRKVASVSGTTISFTAISDRDWAAGTLIHPTVVGRLDQKITAAMRTNAVADVQIRVDETPGSSLVSDAGESTVTFNDREVFLKKPNWNESVQTTFEHPREIVDFMVGRISTNVPIEFPSRVRQSVFVGRTSDEIEDIRKFVDRLRGQQGEFYMPTWEFDIVPATKIYGTTDKIRASGTAIYEAYGDSTVYKAVCVITKAGVRHYRTVLSIARVADAYGIDSLLTLGSTWSADIELADIEMICWMPVWRLASDTFTIEWVTDSAARVQLTMRSLEDLP